MTRNHSDGYVLSRLAAIVYIWHEAQVYQGHGAVTRFYFGRRLDPTVFKEKVLPKAGAISGVLPEDGVRHYPHHITVQWSTHLHEEGETDRTFEETEASIERAVVDILAEAFEWVNPHIVHFTSFEHVRDTAHRLRVDWQANKRL